jgi:exodeoxyribonuclease VII small subunit
MVREVAEKNIPVDIKKMNFEDAMTELQEIVIDLEQGTNKLDDAIGAYERGTLLKRHCELKLREAKERVEKISVGPDGDLISEPIEIS